MPIAYVNGTALHYETSGTGTPIVFIHPPLLNLQVFDYQKEQLAEQFQVITFDVDGHGQSKPSKRKFSYEAIVEDLKQLLDFLAVEKAFLCGYSTGGSLVLEALLTYPDRFYGGIVVSGMSELTDALNKSMAWMAVQMAGSTMLMNVLRRAITLGNADRDETYDRLYTSSSGNTASRVKAYYEQSLIYNCTSRLSGIPHPILLIYGQKDRSFHRYAHLLHSKLQQSSLYFLKDAKHQIPSKSAQKMNDLIRLWVDSLKDEQTLRAQLDLAIAKKLNPSMYGDEVQDEQRTVDHSN